MEIIIIIAISITILINNFYNTRANKHLTSAIINLSKAISNINERLEEIEKEAE